MNVQWNILNIEYQDSIVCTLSLKKPHQLSILACCTDCVDSRILEPVEHGKLLVIIPLGGGDLVEAVDGGHSVDDMCAQEGVDVFCHEFGTAWPVLGPVCHVAHQPVGCS